MRDLFQEILVDTTTKYETPLEAYVIMPEHFHLVLAPPDVKTNSLVLQVLKQRFARSLKKNAPDVFKAAERKRIFRKRMLYGRRLRISITIR
ncbi:transposase [Terriglobus saanensis]|uniref:transposase n=1 Tax=Terriglobus saanensis TaxID=870903 RepID=UPI003CCAB49B